jgi:N-acetylmuramoyl-L-alanine amidase
VKRNWKKWLLLSAVFLLVFPYQALAMKVVIDPGHGGKDPGAVGVNGLKEKDVTLDIGLKVRQALRAKGIEVAMTRETDTYVSLQDRVSFTNRQLADLFVSIHANSSNGNAKGTEVLYYDAAFPQPEYPASPEMEALTEYSKQLAQSLQSTFVTEIGTKDRKIKPDAAYVIRKGTIPSALVETAFIDNVDDAKLLASPTDRTRMANAIADGIAKLAPATLFPDTLGHWSRDAVLRMYKKGWISGYNNMFRPDDSITRAEFVALMNKVFDFSKLSPLPDPLPEKNNPSPDSFTDLSRNHWAYNQLAQAIRLHILSGYGNGKIKPDKPISRAEVATVFQLLREASGKSGPATPGTSHPFTDVPSGYWAEQNINTLKKAGIINGVTSTTFAPEKNMLRGESAALLDNYSSN